MNKNCTAPNITYCKLSINKINNCKECKYYKNIQKIIKTKKYIFESEEQMIDFFADLQIKISKEFIKKAKERGYIKDGK